jgi:hypothetical protein
MKSIFPLVSESDLNTLKVALNFLHVDELKKLCIQFHLSDKNKKAALIVTLVHFIKTGEILSKPTIPSISRAKYGQIYSLQPNTFMLYGAYKNDLKARLFFKQLIGDYFHFTAYGIDWLNERWMSGNPPTYQEFADMWQLEYLRRKNMGSNPKEEWAFINFTQQLIRDYPHASHPFIIDAWKKEREKQVMIVRDIIQSVVANLLSGNQPSQ